LLKICCTQEFNERSSLEITKGAVTLLRQQIEDKWESKDGICESDKQIIRENIVDSMTKCTDLTVMENLEDCMHLIAQEDYPHNWPDVLFQIGENLTSDDDQTCYASL